MYPIFLNSEQWDKIIPNNSISFVKYEGFILRNDKGDLRWVATLDKITYKEGDWDKGIQIDKFFENTLFEKEDIKILQSTSKDEIQSDLDDCFKFYERL